MWDVDGLDDGGGLCAFLGFWQVLDELLLGLYLVFGTYSGLVFGDGVGLGLWWDGGNTSRTLFLSLAQWLG